jgi:hypothetical protein
LPEDTAPRIETKTKTAKFQGASDVRITADIGRRRPYLVILQLSLALNVSVLTGK